MTSYQKCEEVTLKTGEVVEAGIITCPNSDWAPRIKPFLLHKGEPWDTQINVLLTKDVGIQAYVYVVHRNGAPLSSMMCIVKHGVGYFAHVYTLEKERQKGASTHLMRLQLQHFRQNNGKALFLGTACDGVAFKMYKHYGYNEIAPNSGLMAFYTTNQTNFQNEYFQFSSCTLEPLSWSHYPASVALFLRDQPEVIRCVLLRVFGRSLPEEWMLGPILGNLNIWCSVLKNEQEAVVGFSACGPHPFWKGIYVVDVFCHNDFWGEAVSLVQFNLERSKKINKKLLAYVDKEGSEAKKEVLGKLGFLEALHLKERVLVTKKGIIEEWKDVLVFERAQSK